MAPMYSIEEEKLLLEIASLAIERGLATGQILPLRLESYPTKLHVHRATFVTLTIAEELRGCIGTLEAHQPLIQDVARNAFNAAFSDPRFPSLSLEEFSKIDIKISVLTEPESLEFADEEDLLLKIRPGIDGLILQEGSRRGTFLPAVWESVADPKEFLHHLKQKAGLPSDYWSTSLTVQRYTAITISR